MENVKIGAKFEWVGKARGGDKQHIGTVIAIVPGGESVKNYLPDNIGKRAFIGTDITRTDRVLVEENGKYYTPRAALKNNKQ